MDRKQEKSAYFSLSIFSRVVIERLIWTVFTRNEFFCDLYKELAVI